MSGKRKPVKNRGCTDNLKYGVAAKDVEELTEKGCKLLKLPLAGTDVCLYSDGTRVTEEYFHTLSDNTELVLVPRGDTWSGGVTEDVRLLLCSGSLHDELIKAAKELLSVDNYADRNRKILSDLLLNLEDKSELESRDDDKDWFKGVATRFKTKSSYMKHSCESRIRSYTKELVEATKSIQEDRVRNEFVKASAFLVETLKEAKYNGCYFDRTEKQQDRLCTKEGWFTCQGSFDQDECSSLHSINPYSNQESRVVFSTWNLDHRIEKGRTVIPALVEVLQSHKCSAVNLDYFYRLLFTRDNLKLVHIVCHNKAAHNLLCDTKKVLRRRADSQGGKQNARAKKKRLT